MRTLLGFIFFCFIATTTFGDTSEKVVVKTKIHCDHCRQCETCGYLFLHDLTFEKGIKKVELDEKAMEITVFFNPKKTSPGKIRTSISKLGYDADEVPADKVAYEKLDGCCKK